MLLVDLSPSEKLCIPMYVGGMRGSSLLIEFCCMDFNLHSQ